jgi:heat shock protein HslJ
MIGYNYRNKLNMGTKLKSFILTALLFGLLSGLYAQVDSSSEVVVKKSLVINKLSGKWSLIPASESDTAGGHFPEIQFDVKESKFSGNTGCNRMSGTYFIEDSASIHFSDKMITTRIYCAGYNESAFLQNLLRVDGYKFRKGLLILTIGNVEIFRWFRKTAAPKKSTKPKA